MGADAANRRTTRWSRKTPTRRASPAAFDATIPVQERTGDDSMNVSIIGGGGLVGSCAAFALQCGGIVSGIDLIDVNADLCGGQPLALLHGASLVADQGIRSTGYEAIPESDLVMITAGLRRKPDESWL